MRCTLCHTLLLGLEDNHPDQVGEEEEEPKKGIVCSDCGLVSKKTPLNREYLTFYVIQLACNIDGL